MCNLYRMTKGTQEVARVAGQTQPNDIKAAFVKAL